MSGKLRALSAIFAFTILVSAASSTMAQVVRKAQFDPPRDDERGNVATLGCCKCLGGTNTLDLSTVSSNNWTVNGNPVAFLSAIHPLWNLPTGPAKWVSTIASGGTGGIPPGAYEYRLKFVVPACSIDQTVTIAGNYGGDDDVPGVFLDNLSTSSSVSLASCSGGWCFNSTNNTNPRTFTYNVLPGTYYLRVKVQNGVGPSGMFVNAKLSGNCTRDPIKSR
jgi:hypothetical protein